MAAKNNSLAVAALLAKAKVDAHAKDKVSTGCMPWCCVLTVWVLDRMGRLLFTWL